MGFFAVVNGIFQMLITNVFAIDFFKFNFIF